MKRSITAAALLTLGLLALPASAAAPDRSYQLDDTGTTGAKSATWTSDTFAAVAPGFFLGSTAGPKYTCGDPVPNCDLTLFSIRGISQAEIDKQTSDGKPLTALKDSVSLTVGIRNFSVPVSDLDIILWASNEKGERLSEIGRVGALDTDPSEEFRGSVSTTGVNPVTHVLLEVVYFAGAGTYDGYVNVS